MNETLRDVAALRTHIPAIMRGERRWIVWRFIKRGDKYAKVPSTADGKNNPRFLDSRTWLTFEDACVLLQHTGRLDGIGFVLGDGWVGVDLDNVVDPVSFAILSAAADIIRRTASYTEYSPSGRGLKIFGRGHLPFDGNRRADVFGPGTGLEIYDCDRFFTVTGLHLKETPTTVEECFEALAEIYLEFMPVPSRAYEPRAHVSAPPPTEDAVVLGICRSRGQSFAAAYDDGDFSEWKHDRSAVDFFIAKSLAYVTHDREQIKRLMRQSSALRRDKWDSSRPDGQGGRCTWLDQTIERAIEDQRQAYNPNRIIISLVNDARQDRIEKEATAALRIRNDPPKRFHRADGVSVGIIEESDVAEDRNKFPVRFGPMNDADMLSALADDIDWEYKTNRATRFAVPPHNLARVLARPGRSPYPLILSIATAPFLTPSHRLITKPGYDEETRVWFHPQNSLAHPAIGLGEAVRLLREELLVDFMFAEARDAANAIACLLTPFVANALGGRSPLFSIEKPVYGVGGSLLCDCLFWPFVGQSVPKNTWRGDEEVTKIVTAVLRGGSPFLVFDNLPEKPIESPQLAKTLTTLQWADRILQVSDQFVAMNFLTVAATANNPQYEKQLVERVCRVRLVTDLANPRARRGFKHDQPAWVAANRALLVQAALAIIRAWIDEGCPLDREHARGSFIEWSHMLGGMLGVAGVEGFDPMQELIDAAEEAPDDGDSQWEALLAQCAYMYRETEFTAEDMRVVWTGMEDEDRPYLGDTAITTAQQLAALGLLLQKYRDRVVGGWKLVRAREKKKGKKKTQWAVVWVGPGEQPKFEEIPSYIKKDESEF